MPYFSILIIAVSAAFFYRAAELENESSLLWGGLSLLVSGLTMFWLHWSWLGIIISQLGLFVGITIYRILRKN